jgi:hypothetical protein
MARREVFMAVAWRVISCLEKPSRAPVGRKAATPLRHALPLYSGFFKCFHQEHGFGANLSNHFAVWAIFDQRGPADCG